MAFSRASGGPPFDRNQPFLDADQFDVFEWYPYFESCVRYFIDIAQYTGPVQALAAYINIQLPFQKSSSPVLSSRSAGSPSTAGGGSALNSNNNNSNNSKARQLGAAHPNIYPNATLLPYIRRLVATGFDFPAVFHSFFGDDWEPGLSHLHEMERRNYLFAAKSDNWLCVKTAYDMGEDQTIPFLRPLQNVSEKEIVAAETNWSEWLAMQDWMLGPRTPEGNGNGNRRGGLASPGARSGRGVRVKREEDD